MVCNVGGSVVNWCIELVGVGVEDGCQGLGIHCRECGGAGRRYIDLTGERISGGKAGCVWFNLCRLFTDSSFGLVGVKMEDLSKMLNEELGAGWNRRGGSPSVDSLFI